VTPDAEREQLLHVLRRVWLETEPGSDVRRSRRLAASSWRRHLRHRTRPGAVAEEPARDPASRLLVGALDLDRLGDAILAEHEVRLALYDQALALAVAAAEVAEWRQEELVRQLLAEGLGEEGS
jgi:hypothetical protein